MEERKKDNAIIVLSLLLIVMLVFNIYMAVHVRRNIDQCNERWQSELIKHNCIVPNPVPYDLLMVDDDYNVTGGYVWK